MSLSAADNLKGNEAVEFTARSAGPAVWKKRCVIYAMNYAPELAGAGRYTGEIAEHIAAHGYDVTVVTTPPHYPEWQVRAGYANRYSSSVEGVVRVIRTPLILKARMKGIWRLLAPLSFAISSAPVIFWQIVSRRTDTVFCVEPTLLAAPVAQLAARLVGARIILHVQDIEVEAAFSVGHLRKGGWLEKLGRVFEHVTHSGFDQVVTISNRMAARLASKGVASDRLSVVRNWVDLAHIYPLGDVSPYRQELGFSSDDFVILYSGTIGAKQGLDLLLDAAECLKQEARIHFVIAGEGPCKETLRACYGHLLNVRFLPFQPHARLNEFLNMPDLHILPQDRSAADLGMPSKTGSMLASGRPILVTADAETELAEFLAGAAMIVPPGDVEALCKAIVSLRDGAFETPAVGFDLAQSLSKPAALQAITEAYAR